MQELPANSGIELANWNWKVVCQYASQRFGISLSRSTCLNYLHRLGFAFKRPKKRLLKADDAQRESFLGEYAALREEARRTGARIFFADEAHLRADAELRGKWALRGEPALVDSTSPRYGEKASYYSAVCLETGEVEWMELEGNSNSGTSATFLGRVAGEAWRSSERDLGQPSGAPERGGEGVPGAPRLGVSNSCRSGILLLIMDVVSRRISLTAWGRLHGFDKATTSRLHHTGKLPPELQIEQLPNGRYYVVVPPENDGRCVVYARVSSGDQREDLDRQVGRVVEWATQQGYRPDEVVKEIGSGLNGNRRGLRRLVSDHTVSMIMVEYRERLCRFGFEYVEAALAARGARILVMEEGELEDDLVRDATEVMTSLCARLYGRRSARRRAERALAAAREGL